MVGSGFRILHNVTFGPVKAIAKTGPLMLSTVHRNTLSFALLILTSFAAYAENSPRMLQEPVLGLQYEREKVKFEPLSRSVASQCDALNDNENIKGVWFVFARASDASGRAYYLLNGYSIRKRPNPPDYPKYTAGGSGFILGVDGKKCEVLEADARQLFKDRIFDDEFPFDMMQKLAVDFAARLSKAYGGSDRLRMEISKQRIDLNKQPDEIRYALKELIPAK